MQATGIFIFSQGGFVNELIPEYRVGLVGVLIFYDQVNPDKTASKLPSVNRLVSGVHKNAHIHAIRVGAEIRFAACAAACLVMLKSAMEPIVCLS